MDSILRHQLERRVIPTLLLKGSGLVKGKNFSGHRYVGDPLNAVKIFNDKEADELIFLDIEASKEGRTISIDIVTKLSEECLMPFGVGGGIKTVEQARSILAAGAEKVVLNTSFFQNPSLAGEIAACFGIQSVAVSIDYKNSWLSGKKTYFLAGKKQTKLSPLEAAILAENNGAGEIMLQSIDKEGTLSGYDIETIHEVSSAVSIPVIASGGGHSLEDFRRAISEGGASAVAAGAYFVFHGRKNAVLINYPERKELRGLFA